MDPLTHALLGANLGYVVGHRRLGRLAAGVGAWAAFIPDGDVIIKSASDPLLAVEYHRHFTHALAFAPVGAGLAAACFAWNATVRRFLGCAWFCALVGYVSHELLDSATSYGTQLLWPFSRMRVGWDLISIVDPVFTLALAIGLGVVVARRRWDAALATLGFAACYLCFGGVQHGRAREAVAQLAESRGHQVLRDEIMPGMANNIIWRTLYEFDGRIYSDRVRVGWFSSPQVREGSSLPIVHASQLTAEETQRTAANRDFERFAWFSDDWVARSPSDATVLADMRYSLSASAFDPIWGIRFTPSGASTSVEWINRSRDRSVNAAEMWREIVGSDERYHALPLGKTDRD